MMTMRTVSVVAFVVLLGLPLLVQAVTPQDFKEWEKGENLVVAGDFEDCFIQGNSLHLKDGAEEAWTLEDAKCCDRGGEYTWEIDENEFHTGEASLKVIGVIATGTNWHGKVRHESTSMEAGEQYTVAFWAKAVKTRPVSLSVQLQHDPWTGFQGGDFTLTEEWAEYTKTFAATENIDRDMWVGLSIAASDVDFWLDDFRFWEGEFDDEITAEPKPQAVDARGKLSTVWSSLK